jgi:hypothetical protein
MNTIFVLILFAHVGPMGDGNSNAITTQEFTTQAKCEAAGKKAESLSRGSTKIINFVCTEK